MFLAGINCLFDCCKIDILAVALLLHYVIAVRYQVEVWRQFHVNLQQNNITLQLPVRLVLSVLLWPQA